MILYFSIIFVAMIIVSLCNIFIVGGDIIDIIAMVVIATAFQFAIDGIFALIVKWLPNSWFGSDKKCFNVGEKERKLYESLKIRKWKDKVWELGGIGGFSKNKIQNPDSVEYFDMFLLESNKGVVDHLLGCFVGYLVMFILPAPYTFTIAIPVGFVNMFLNLLPIMILRYNTPKLKAARMRLIKKHDTKKNTEPQI